MIGILSCLFRRYIRSSTPNLPKLTPDELISSKIINMIAKDFESVINLRTPESWVLRERDGGYYSNSSRSRAWNAEYIKWGACSDSDLNKALVCLSKDITILYQQYGDYKSEFFVNGIELSAAEGIKIINAFEKLKTGIEEAKAKAKEARAKLELENRKWDLAEKLLGMKRTETGALVPKETID